MKRRNFFSSVAAATTLAAQQPQSEIPKLAVATADDIATIRPKFFSPAHFAAMSKLAEILVPTPEGGVGAKEAGAAEFLDFLLSKSLPDRQQVYLKGIDALNAASKQKFQKTFDALSEPQATEIMAPLRKPWTYEPSPDPLTRFLQAAKADVRIATQNSKPYSLSSASSGARRMGGTGLYWYPLD
jgi:hypothetical protein